MQHAPLAGKLGAMIADMAGQLAEIAGERPAYVKVCLQMPDDSVYEARGDLCADGCGQVAIVPSVTPRLGSPS